MTNQATAYTWKPGKTGWFLIILWAIVQGALLVKNGIHTDLEAQVYINVANHLLDQGSFEAAKSWFYLIPILLIAVCIKTGIGYAGVVVVQILVNGLATVCFHHTCRRLGASRTATLAATILLILFIPLQVWNTFLYTESLFISFAMIGTYLVLRAPLSVKGIIITLLVLVVLLFTRPSGILFLVPAFMYILQRGITGRYALLKRTGIALVSALIVMVFVNTVYKTGGGDLDIMKPYIEEHIICFIPSGHTPTLDIAHTGQPVQDLWYYITHNPAHFTKLFFLRLFAFFNLSRPYYSFAHNGLLLALIILIYLLAIKGFVALCRRLISAHWYLLWLVGCYAIAIAFQCDDYHSRFIMVIMPVLFYFAGVGLGSLLSKKPNLDFSRRK